MVCSIFYNSNIKTHLKETQFLDFQLSGSVGLGPISWSCQCGLWHLPKTWHSDSAAQVLTVMTRWSCSYDITEVFPFVLIRQSWPSFKNACFFSSEWFMWHTWLVVQLRSWRGSIYCRWQWITRTGVRFTFPITMVIDAFEACWPACSEINSHIAETLGQRWRTEEMLECEHSLVTAATAPQGWGPWLKAPLQ